MYELCYWIMSIGNQKRIGAYLPFKNFKTTKEAMQKLLSEAKKIGVKITEYDADKLSKGYGDDICRFLDDILNRELIRRDYKFFNPVIPPDIESDEESEINSGEVSTFSTANPLPVLKEEPEGVT